jgi:hypothetical protein
MVSRIPEHAHPKILLVHRAKEKTTRKAEEDANSKRRARRASSLNRISVLAAEQGKNIPSASSSGEAGSLVCTHRGLRRGRFQRASRCRVGSFFKLQESTVVIRVIERASFTSACKQAAGELHILSITHLCKNVPLCKNSIR